MIFVVLGAPQGSPVNIPTSGIPIYILVNAVQPEKASSPIFLIFAYKKSSGGF